jgi:Tfp pilus assembly protein PilX
VWRWGVEDQRGVALVLALAVLAGLSALALALLSISALEPQISRNHADMLRVRYLAEAGIEHAYDTLASTVGAWSAHLSGATCTAGAVLTRSTLPGLASAQAEYTVSIRNDCGPGDDRLTGVALEAGTDAMRDTNRTVIVASTGRIVSTTHTITVVISADVLPDDSGQSVPFPRLSTHGWADR